MIGSDQIRLLSLHELISGKESSPQRTLNYCSRCLWYYTIARRLQLVEIVDLCGTRFAPTML